MRGSDIPDEAMSDQAHEWTDEQIANLSAKIRETYEQAAKEMEGKLESWLKDYESKRSEWEQRVKDGAATQEEFRDWLSGQATYRDWQQAMIDELANGAVNADVMCRQLINDELPRIFAENANYGAYDVDTKLGYDTGFTLADRDTVMRLIKDNPELLPAPRVDIPKDTRWNRDKFASAVTQGVLQGESVPNLAKRLRTVFEMDKRASIRAARTSFTSAENAGRINSYERAKRIGINMQQEWLATLDMRTRHTHRLLDGQRVPVGGYFEPDGYGEKYRVRFPADPHGLPEMVWNCFVGDTLVTTDSGIEASYMHKYVGDLVTIDTSAGVHFTCTPNHPILTTRGWIAAAELNKGDDLLVTGRKNGERAFGKPDINHAFASIETVHEFAKVFFANRASVAGVDFHGDVATSNVEIIAKKRLLGFGFNPSVCKGIVKLLFKPSDSLDLCDGTPMERFGRVMPSTSGLVRSLGVFLSLFFGHGSHADVHRFRATPDGDASIEEYPIDDLPATTIIRSELLDGLVGQVFVDNVISVNVSSTSGTHVYNLQTGDGYYFVNEKNNGNFIIAKNCRCTLIAAVAGVDTSDAERWSKLPDGMTYDEWKGAKKEGENGQKEQEKKPTIDELRKSLDDRERALKDALRVRKPNANEERWYRNEVEKYKGFMNDYAHAKDYDEAALTARSMDLENQYYELGKVLENLGLNDPKRREIVAQREELGGKLRDINKKLYDLKTYNRYQQRYKSSVDALEQYLSTAESDRKKYEDAQASIPTLIRERNAAIKALSEAQPFGPQVREKIGDDFADAMADALDKATEKHPAIAAMYRMFGSKLNVIDHENNDGAYYRGSSKGIWFNAAEDVTGSSFDRPYEVIFHEFAHLIDNVSQYQTNYLTGTEDLRSVIMSDWANFRNALGRADGVTRDKNGHAIRKLRTEMYAAEDGAYAYASLSDVIEGCTRQSCPLGYGHGVSYHRQDGKTAREFFAEVCSAAIVNERSYEQMRRVFPNAVTMVESMIEGMIV